MRKKFIAGNWKMNKTPSEAAALALEISEKALDAKCDVVVCPAAVCIPGVISSVDGTNVEVGAQNVHFKENGAYTGELSAAMLTDAGVKYVIIGHSERRQYFGETDETVNLRTRTALSGGLLPIVCIGESLGEREDGIMYEVVRRQAKLAMMNISADEAAGVIIAYEPVWAIGTGKTATAEQADEVCGIIRSVMGELYGDDTAEKIRILYGGSMNASNAAELLAQPNIDGGLIGGASLKPGDFAEIIKAASV
ncbi:MAG TPA: triose-phosphate isomerase [Candidatus Monoglobus merdigallinarum]|uniref:Triosephosphate isomerase n=1 Tax=Candidatus Monoglobus merdigallinarum TaxID=2838698 RepID=A0A9D1TLV4_9FIRM|nr:triose-phosphate isomerase [Candidatus Monoglobus merdigallinarum]